MANARWTRNEAKRALYLYFQLPFGQLHSGNPEIIKLARDIGRTPSSIAMKLANFASLDPKITETGRKGLDGASALDREIWAEFHRDWTKSIIESDELGDDVKDGRAQPNMVKDAGSDFSFNKYEGKSVAVGTIKQRIGQNFFRRAVLANYDMTCCVTGISDERLLNASHIVPWSADEVNRHNPKNGLCMSATFDRAFDRGLMTVLPSLEMRFAKCLGDKGSEATRAFFAPYESKRIRPSVRFDPDPNFLEWHNENCFVDA